MIAEAQSEREYIDKRAIRTIHTAKSYLSLTEDTYRNILKVRYNVPTSKDLTPDQGADLIAFFKRIGFGSTKRRSACSLCIPRQKGKPIPAETIYPASIDQLSIIEILKWAIRWQVSDGYSRWLNKYFALTEIKWSPEASVVINALKRLLKSQNKCSSCAQNLVR